MTKRLNRKYGISRRLGVNLWGRAKDPFGKKNYPPGAHGLMGYKRSSDYGLQLQAKQKLRGYYGNITEKQFRGLYLEAMRCKGDTGQNLVKLLESRLDAFVYRSKFAPTVFAARQLVNHKHVTVNGKAVNIPSCSLNPGDVVEIKERSRSLTLIASALSSNERSIPDYIALDAGKLSSKYLRRPELLDVPYAVVMDPHLVIEYYSR